MLLLKAVHSLTSLFFLASFLISSTFYWTLSHLDVGDLLDLHCHRTFRDCQKFGDSPSQNVFKMNTPHFCATRGCGGAVALIEFLVTDKITCLHF